MNREAERVVAERPHSQFKIGHRFYGRSVDGRRWTSRWTGPGMHAGHSVPDEETCGLLDEIVRLRAEVAALKADSARLAAALRDVLASAVPNEQEHPAMHAAWINARAALAASNPSSTKAAGAAD